MSHATLKLTDCPEGLNMEVMYEGGYNPLSPAHTHIEALIGKMAELAEPVGEAIHLSADEVAAMRIKNDVAHALANTPDGFCPGCGDKLTEEMDPVVCLALATGASPSDVKSAMQANKLLTAKGAQELPAAMPVVRMSKAEVGALSQITRGPDLVVTPRPIPEMTGDTIKVSRPMPYESTAAQNRAQFDRLMADDQRESLWVRLHTLSKILESSGVIDLHAQPEAYGTILDAMKAVAEQGG